MSKENEEILLHDYFDNLLSEEEQNRFEDLLLDNIDLAIELGKLKNLQRNLNNLPSTFTPSEKTLDNILNSLLNNNLSEKEAIEKKKEKNFFGKEKKEAKPRQKFKPKTKFRIKQIFSVLISIAFISALIFGYFLYVDMNNTTPWFVKIVNKSDLSTDPRNKNIELNINSLFETKKSELAEILIQDAGIIKLNENTKIEVKNGTKSLNSIIYLGGSLSFIPDFKNGLFELIYNNIAIKSSNSEFSIDTTYGNIEVSVLSNFIYITINGFDFQIPSNYKFSFIGENSISIPINMQTSPEFANLINTYSLSGNEFLLSKIIHNSSKNDVFTLFYLLPQVSPEFREKIIDELSKISPLNSSLTKENILLLDQNALNNWWEEINLALNQ